MGNASIHRRPVSRPGAGVGWHRWSPPGAGWRRGGAVRDEHREGLIYMLCEAAELEHGIMCRVPVAAFSLKQGEQEA